MWAMSFYAADPEQEYTRILQRIGTRKVADMTRTADAAATSVALPPLAEACNISSNNAVFTAHRFAARGP